jgi:hypothetical protein
MGISGGMDGMGGCLCISCLKKRLGRTLVPKDFLRNHPFNLMAAPNGYYHAGPKRKPIPDAACMPQRAPLARPLRGGGTIATTAGAGVTHPP